MNTIPEGSVRKAGDRLRITAQLVNVSDGYQAWSQRFDRRIEDVFAIQDEIVFNIVSALRAKLTGGVTEVISPRRRAESLEAFSKSSAALLSPSSRIRITLRLGRGWRITVQEPVSR